MEKEKKGMVSRDISGQQQEFVQGKVEQIGMRKGQ